jgi:hypothetical protein
MFLQLESLAWAAIIARWDAATCESSLAALRTCILGQQRRTTCSAGAAAGVRVAVRLSDGSHRRGGSRRQCRVTQRRSAPASFNFARCLWGVSRAALVYAFSLHLRSAPYLQVGTPLLLEGCDTPAPSLRLSAARICNMARAWAWVDVRDALLQVCLHRIRRVAWGRRLQFLAWALLLAKSRVG